MPPPPNYKPFLNNPPIESMRTSLMSHTSPQTSERTNNRTTGDVRQGLSTGTPRHTLLSPPGALNSDLTTPYCRAEWKNPPKSGILSQPHIYWVRSLSDFRCLVPSQERYLSITVDSHRFGCWSAQAQRDFRAQRNCRTAGYPYALVLRQVD